MLKEIKTKKAAGIDNLAGKFLKDSSERPFVLLELIFAIFPSNFLIRQMNAQLQKLSFCIKKISKLA